MKLKEYEEHKTVMVRSISDVEAEIMRIWDDGDDKNDFEEFYPVLSSVRIRTLVRQLPGDIQSAIMGDLLGVIDIPDRLER